MQSKKWHPGAVIQNKIFKSWISVNGPLYWGLIRNEPAAPWEELPSNTTCPRVLLSNTTYPQALALCFGWKIRIRHFPTSALGKRVFKNLNSYLIHAQTSSPNRESGTPITLKTKNRNKIIIPILADQFSGLSWTTKSLVSWHFCAKPQDNFVASSHIYCACLLSIVWTVIILRHWQKGS